MSYKLILDSKQIANKEFDTVTNGYPIKDVDLFLDTIVDDYKQMETNTISFQKQIIKLKKQISQLEIQNQQLKNNKYSLQKKIDDIDDGKGFSFIDILGRISKTEDDLINVKDLINNQLEEIKNLINSKFKDK